MPENTIPCLNDEDLCPESCPCAECVDITRLMDEGYGDDHSPYDERLNYALGSAATGITAY
jgi:hypothetical protein